MWAPRVRFNQKKKKKGWRSTGSNWDWASSAAYLARLGSARVQQAGSESRLRGSARELSSWAWLGARFLFLGQQGDSGPLHLLLLFSSFFFFRG